MLLRSIAVKNYRCLRDVHVELSNFQLLVGANASGKSTLLDALAFVGRIISDGLEAAVEERVSDPRDLVWQRQGGDFRILLDFEVPPQYAAQIRANDCDAFGYSIYLHAPADGSPLQVDVEIGEFLPRGRGLSDASSVDRPKSSHEGAAKPRTRSLDYDKLAFLRLANDEKGDRFIPETGAVSDKFRFDFGPGKSVLENLPEDETRFPVSLAVKRFLTTGLRKVVLAEKALRNPAPKAARNAAVFDGSALPWLVEELIRTDQPRFQRWIAHVRFALPDLEAIRVIERPEDRTRYLMLHYRNGLEIPSWLASEGTLRLLALTLPAYLPNFQGLYLVEEPENGIHPLAIEAVYQSLASVYSAQVLLATHSPVLVGLAQPKEVLCFARDDDGATTITRGDQHPRLRDWKGETVLGSLFAAGVLS